MTPIWGCRWRGRRLAAFNALMNIRASARPRLKARNCSFAGSELSRLCLGVLRTAPGELLSTDDITVRVITAKGFNSGDAILRVAIREQVGSVVKRLHRNGEVENIEQGARAGEAGRRLVGLAFPWYVAGGHGIAVPARRG